jgi:hypothetical protein
MPDDATYSLWIAGTKRFAVVRGKTASPVVGYIFQNHEGSWSIEHRGMILKTVYRSSSDAALAVLSLEQLKEG